MELKQGGTDWIILIPGVTIFCVVVTYTYPHFAEVNCKNEPGILWLHDQVTHFSWLFWLCFSSQFLCTYSQNTSISNTNICEKFTWKFCLKFCFKLNRLLKLALCNFVCKIFPFILFYSMHVFLSIYKRCFENEFILHVIEVNFSHNQFFS